MQLHLLHVHWHVVGTTAESILKCPARAKAHSRSSISSCFSTISSSTAGETRPGKITEDTHYTGDMANIQRMVGIYYFQVYCVPLITELLFQSLGHLKQWNFLLLDIVLEGHGPVDRSTRIMRQLVVPD